MNRPLPCLFALLLICVRAGTATAQSGDSASVGNPKLRQGLLEMAEADQAVRREMDEKGWSTIDSLDVARQDSVDEANQARLEEIIRRHGWPTREEVGRDGGEAAFLVVQHGDLAFQRAMLPYVQEAFEAGDLEGQDMALLTDRVLMMEGKPQRYGTQAELVEGEVVVWPLENEGEVDAWRAELGLPSLSEYVKLLQEMYEDAAAP